MCGGSLEKIHKLHPIKKVKIHKNAALFGAAAVLQDDYLHLKSPQYGLAHELRALKPLEVVCLNLVLRRHRIRQHIVAGAHIEAASDCPV